MDAADFEMEFVRVQNPLLPSRVQSVLRVIRFSSQYGGDLPPVANQDTTQNVAASYSVKNLEGGPSVYPQYGDATRAAVFRTFGSFWKRSLLWLDDSFERAEDKWPTSDDFVDLFYQEAVHPSLIQVFETFNLGHVCKISAGFAASAAHPVDSWSVLWHQPLPEPAEELNAAELNGGDVTPLQARIFSPSVKKLDRPVNVIRLEMCSIGSNYYPEIDTVCLGGNPASDYFFQAQRVNPNDEDNTLATNLTALKLSSSSEAADNNRASLDSLPAEIIHYIVHCCSNSNEKLSLIFKLSAVSRHFRACLSDPALFTKVDLKPIALRCLTKEFFSFIEARSGGLHQLRLSWLPALPLLDCVGGGGGGISKIVQPQVLTTFSAQACPFVNDSFLELLCSLQMNLENLDLSGCRYVTPHGFACLANLRKIKRISLYRTLIDQFTLRLALCSFHKLEVVNLGSLTLVSNADAICATLAEFCPSLRAIDFWRAGASLTNRGVKELATGCHLLEEVDFGWCNKVTPESLRLLVTMCHNLRRIMLTANRQVTDEDLMGFADLSLLEQLDILGSSVSLAAVTGLLLACRKMFYLDISYCGLEASEMAELRQNFPAVHIPVPST